MRPAYALMPGPTREQGERALSRIEDKTHLVAKTLHVGLSELLALAELGDPAVNFVLHAVLSRKWV